MSNSAAGVPGPLSENQIVWSRHARERITARKMSQQTLIRVLSAPDFAVSGKQPDTFEYGKKHGSKTTTVIIKPVEGNKYLILSCWIDPPEYGTSDWKDKQYYNAYHRSKSVWGKLWILLKQQLRI